MEVPIAEELKRTRKKRRNSPAVEASPAISLPENVSGESIPVSLFDYSVENHFEAVDTISKLTGVPEIDDDSDRAEIQRLASSVTFLTEWRYLNYESKEVKFACEDEISEGTNVIGEIILPQFSSAEVPKKQLVNEQAVPEKSSKDFVMYVGGLVWGMDWCPQAYKDGDAPIKSEFVAVAVHPPGSSYTKIGAPLTGRGVIQIWCLLDLIQKEDLLAQINKKRNRNSIKNIVAKGETSGTQKPRGRPRKSPGESVKGETSGTKKPRGRPRKSPGESVKGETSGTKKPRGRPRKSPGESVNGEMPGPRKPRGRPRKQPINEPLGDRDCDAYNSQPLLAIEYPQQSSELSVDWSRENTIKAKEDFAQNQEMSIVVASLDDRITSSKRIRLKNKARAKYQSENSGASSSLTYASTTLVSAGSNESGASTKKRKEGQERTENETHDSTLALQKERTENQTHDSTLGLGKERTEIQTHDSTLALQMQDVDDESPDIPTDVSLPRMVLSLAHNGKIARDVKWRPSDNGDVSRYRMGYLAVILGNGALEVWEVPFPHLIKAIYPSGQKKGTDPRFLKLQPVFRCSMLKCFEWQSIPLAVEWSTSPPYDMILAGCHDGVVALWKFSANNSSKDTRPLLCFSAETVPIRALSWAPFESDAGNPNIIITAGDKGLKFWDLRDPFHPLREYNPGQGVNICSVDWLPEPRCVIISCDDGTIKILSLPKAAYDLPVTGNNLSGTKQLGFHNYTRSLGTIWSIQASRVTGMAAYCGADGTAVRFQMTRGMETDAVRNRTPHYLCGSFSEDESGLTVITPVPNSPFRSIYSGKQWRDTILKSNQEKRAVEQSDEQPLALCYGDDLNVEEGSDDELLAQKNKQTSETRTKTANKKPGADERGPICNEEEATGLPKDKLPPKNVSINRVRWNMNKGSQRWLCYGGTAGLVRCQKITTIE